jgi:hypothetical protein
MDYEFKPNLGWCSEAMSQYAKRELMLCVVVHACNLCYTGDIGRRIVM